MHVFIYTKIKENDKRFIYKTPDTLQKSRQFALRFIYKKPDTLRYNFFLKKIEIGVYIKKTWHFALHDFFIYKIQTLRKNQDNLHCVFIYKKPETLRYAIFCWIFKIGGGGGEV